MCSSAGLAASFLNGSAEGLTEVSKVTRSAAGCVEMHDQ
jgi:hypothetical protein